MAQDRIDPSTGRYLPILYPEEAPYWEAAKKHKLVLQRCRPCGKTWYPIGPVCPFCLSDDFAWAEMSGKGSITSFVVYHKGWIPWFQERVPYAVVQVQLKEGPRLTTNLLDTPVTDIKIGTPVEAAFEDVNDEITLVQFRPSIS